MEDPPHSPQANVIDLTSDTPEQSPQQSRATICALSPDRTGSLAIGLSMDESQNIEYERDPSGLSFVPIL